MSTSFRRQASKLKAKPSHMSPTNNRKRTAGRIVQVDPTSGRQIRHNPTD